MKSQDSTKALRHAGVVRVTHWLTFVCFAALLLSGLEIVLSHPRFYWGETGNVNMKPLFTLHVPSSRDTVPTGYHYVLPDQNGWSRSLHFEAAWLVLLTGLVYVVFSIWTDHFRRDLWPARGQRSWAALRAVFAKYRRRKRLSEDEAAYNAAQRWAYVAVLCVLFPLVVWTGLALSPAFNAAMPWAVDALGGRQSARTLHFFVSGALVLFFVGHVAMVALSGFRPRVWAMVTGRQRAGGQR